MRPPRAWPLPRVSVATSTQLIQAAFTVNASRQIVQGYAQNMTQAFGSNQKGKATWYGFQILAAIDTAGRLQGTLQANSNLAVATFPCMSLGTATLPTSLTTELGDGGAFGVRGRPATDNEAVVSHNGIWIIEPPVDKSWQDITTLQARTGITGDTANADAGAGHARRGDRLQRTGRRAAGRQLRLVHDSRRPPSAIRT